MTKSLLPVLAALLLACGAPELEQAERQGKYRPDTMPTGYEELIWDDIVADSFQSGDTGNALVLGDNNRVFGKVSKSSLVPTHCTTGDVIFVDDYKNSLFYCVDGKFEVARHD